MRIAIITENFLPKLDGVTRALARLLEFLQTNGHKALLLGPESAMEWHAGAEIVGTAGFPLPFYPELKFNLFRPLFIRRLKEFQPHIVHLVDPVILGAAGLAAARFLEKPKPFALLRPWLLLMHRLMFLPFHHIQRPLVRWYWKQWHLICQ
jgi:glycosyltransferase involved in cell wall biosynthesis